jgi:hypothetical protein
VVCYRKLETDFGMQVYILLFGVGAFETEGIYSMRAVMNNDGLPIDTIIAFESQEDAERWTYHSFPLISDSFCQTAVQLLLQPAA